MPNIKCTPAAAKVQLVKTMRAASQAPDTRTKTEVLMKGYHEIAQMLDPKDYPKMIETIEATGKLFPSLRNALPNPAVAFNLDYDPTSLEVKKEFNTSDGITNEEAAKKKSEVKRTFFRDRFGKEGARAQMYFQRQVRDDLVNAFLVDRKRGRLVTEETINANVRDLKLELLDRINEYLTKSLGIDTMAQHGTLTLFPNPDTISDILAPNANLRKLIEMYLAPGTAITSRKLQETYKNYKNKGKGWENDKRLLDAYNAWIALNHFDTLIDLTMGGMIKMNAEVRNQLSEKSYYSTNLDKATNMWSNGFGDENEDIADLVSDVTQMLVQSSRYYAWQSTEAMEDKYLSFQDFNDSVGKIKKLVDSPLAKSIKIGALKGTERLTTTTQNILNQVREINIQNGNFTERRGKRIAGDPSIYEIVSLISKNPQDYLHAIFDIIANTDLVNKLNDAEGRPLFNDIDKNIMWSINMEIFGHTPAIAGRSTRSIFDLHENTTGDRIYEIVSQIADSMFSEDYLLYYQDRNGKFQTRLLKDYALDQLKRELKSEMQESNGMFNKDKFDTFKSTYNVEVETRESSIAVNKDGSEVWKIDAGNGTKIPLTTNLLKSVKTTLNDLVEITCNADGANVNILSANAEQVWKDTKFRNFIKDLLGIDFNTDVDYASALEETYKDANGVNYDSLVKKLSNLAGVVLFNQTFNNDILPQVMKDGNRQSDRSKSIRQVIQSQYGDPKYTPEFNRELGIVNMIPGGIESAYLRELATARAINYSMLSSALVKTGEGTALANFCLSRLRNSHHYQLVTQNKKADSASRELSYVNNENGLYEGIVSRREVKTDQIAKASTGFSAIESYQLSFINDWVSAFIHDKDDNTYLGDGHASFLPTVNSDKSQIDGLLCNLNAISKQGIRYLDMNDIQIEDEMVREFGPMYNKIAINIGKQIQRLTDFIGVNTADLASVSPIEFNRTILDRINQYYIGKAKPGEAAGKAISRGLHEDLTRYNKTHTRNPIQIGDQVHYIQDKKTGLLGTNKCLEALWGRFYATDALRNALITPLYKKGEESAASVRGFFKMKDLQTVRELLRDGFQMPLYGKKALDQKEIKFLRGELEGSEFLKGWTTLTDGSMALAKVNGTPTNDLALIESADPNTVQIHPMVSRLNRMSYLTTQQYVCAVGGAHYVYKGGGKDVLKEEAARWLASNKRNVCYASTVHKYQAATLDGVPNRLNMAIIDDIKADVYSIMGDLDGHKPIDGGMFVNGWFGDLENNSLAGERAGVDKKQFGTFYFEDYCAGGIIKTAGFAATNDRMRRSQAWRNLQKNMSDRPWVKEFAGPDGADVLENDIDITIDRYGNTIDWGQVYYKRVVPTADGKREVRLFRLAGVKRVGSNTYEIYEYPVTSTGTIDRTHPEIAKQKNTPDGLQPIKRMDGSNNGAFMINTNWNLFTLVFGGYNSLEMKGNRLQPSENSRKLMVRALNNIGYKRDDAHGYAGRQVDKIRTQDDFWQPLKYSDCHYTPNIGAIKSSYFNVNPSSAMSEVQDLNHMVIDMAQLGIQLDKEHHADEAEVSMPTQIIQACANKGYTIAHSSELYNALSTLTELSIADCMAGVEELLGNGTNTGKLLKEVAKIIVDNLIHGSSDNEVLDIVFEHLINKAEAGEEFTREDIEGRIPWSSSDIYSLVYSKIASSLTNSAIKMKFPGSLSVICPTHKMENFHGDRQLSSFEKIENGALCEEDALAAYQQEVLQDKGLDANGIPTNKFLIFDTERDGSAGELEKRNLASRIQTQHNYVVEFKDNEGNIITQKYTINTPHDYYRIKDYLVNGADSKRLKLGLVETKTYSVHRIYENVIDGRELGAYNVRYRDTNGASYNIFDLDSTSCLFKLNEFKDDAEKIDKELATEEGQKKYADLVAEFTGKQAIKDRYSTVMKIINKQLGTKYKFINNVPKTGEGYNAIRKALRIAFYKEQELDLFKLSKDYNGTRTLWANGAQVTINPSSLEIIPYELMMPKIYQTYFNLEEYDDLQEIMADEDFFTKRSIDRLKRDDISDVHYDFCLKKMNGEHVYIVDSRNGLGYGVWEENPNFMKRTNDDGTIERINEDGETMYSLANAKDKVMYKAGTAYEVIVTDNPEYYIEHIPHNFVKFSNLRVTEDQLQRISDNLKESHSRTARKFYRDITTKKGELRQMVNLRGRNDFIDRLSLTAVSANKPDIMRLIENIKQDGRELHASFSKSLDILAARIPAQSQQSFMPQRVIAFDTKNINTAMVSTFQLFLQGSDLDIDAVTLLGSEFDKSGRYVMWSPYANLESIPNLAASLEIPFPTGKKTIVANSNKHNSFFVDLNDFFGNGNLFNIATEKDEAGNITTVKTKDGHPKLEIDLTNPANIRKFAQFIKYINGHGLNIKGELDPEQGWVKTLEFSDEITEYPDLNLFKMEGVSEEDAYSILSQLEELASKHNLYIKTAPRITREQMAKNQCQYRMMQISSAPSNLVESMVGVDQSTDPIKNDEYGAKSFIIGEDGKPIRTKYADNDSYAALGNEYTKHSSILEGQVGKQCVGIGAVSIKVNSTTLFYVDKVLNGTDEAAKEKLLFPITDKKLGHRGYIIGGKRYSTLANIYDKTKEDPNAQEVEISTVNGKVKFKTTQQNADVLKMLAALENNEEIPSNVATSLAAMLSVAVDNAKDLALAKMNAGPKTFGFYAYGISLGMDIRDLAKIINSEQGRAITKLTEGNVFTGEFGAFTALQAMDKLNGKIYSDLIQFDEFLYVSSGEIGKVKLYPTDEGVSTPSAFLEKALKPYYDAWIKQIEEGNKRNKDKNILLNSPNTTVKDKQTGTVSIKKKGKLTDMIYQFAITGHLEEMLKSLENSDKFKQKLYPTVGEGNNAADWRADVYQLLNWCKRYGQILKTFREGQFNEAGIPNSTSRAKDLAILAQGAEEMRILGTILSSNKGIKSKIDEGNTFIETIENAIVDRKEIAGIPAAKDDHIDFIAFVTDPDYRLSKIDAYDKVKHSVNILDVITKAPHFLGYLRACAIPYAAFLSSSAKFRARDRYVKGGLFNKLGISDSKGKDAAVRGVENAVSFKMLKKWLASEHKTFILPKGSKYFKSRQEGLVEVTDDAGMTIPLWTDEGLATFKRYMETEIIPNLKSRGDYSYNQFVQGLTQFELSKTGTHATVSAYTLSGNMLPNTEQEEAQMQTYVADFSDMLSFKFPNSWKDRTSYIQGTIPNYQDAFYIYSQYVFSGRKSRRSLVSLFANADTPMIRSHRNYVAQVDANEDIYLTDKEIITWCAPQNSGNSTYFYAVDKDIVGTQLQKKVDSSALWGMHPSEPGYAETARMVQKGYRLYDKAIKDTPEARQYFINPNAVEVNKAEVKFPLSKGTDPNKPAEVKVVYDAQTMELVDIKVTNNDEMEKIIPLIKDDIRVMAERKFVGNGMQSVVSSNFLELARLKFIQIQNGEC